LTVGLTLGLGGGLVLMLHARPEAPAPAAADKEAPPKIAASKITNVTVYPNNALVTREVEVPAGAGTMELVVSPLPERTMNSTLYSEGSDGTRVLTTRFRTRPVKENTREEVRKLEDEIRKLQENARKIQADLMACTQNMGLLVKLEDFAAASTKNATEKGKLDSEATIALAKYLMEGRSEKTKDKVNLEQQLANNAEQLAFVQRKLNEMSAGSSRTERDAVIVVDKTNAAPGTVRLNYLVDAAQWRPQYKLRAGKTAKDAVLVEYLAAVMQHSGEDWRGVNLVLSTAQPMLNADPPEMKVLAVSLVPRGTPVASLPPIPNPPNAGPGGFGGAGVGGGGRGGLGMPAMPAQANQPMGQSAATFASQFAPGARNAFANPMGNTSVDQLNRTAQALRAQAQQEFNQKKDSTANEITNYAAALEQARDLVLQVEQQRKPAGKGVVVRAQPNEGPSVTYHLNARLTVPSRSDEQVIEVARIDMKPDYFYKAVPVLTAHVYRQANLTNASKYVLLPGEATMYNGADFVGRMNLPLVAIGEQFTAGFGSDPQLQVQRQMMDKSRSQQGGNQVLKYEYRILLSSYKPEKVKVQVWDRLPAAENETMGVSLVKAAPDLCKDSMYLREDRPHNLLRWDLELGPEMNGEKAQAIQYEFKLELDRQMTIGTFESKSK
jgi:hypothetical protein